MICVYHFKGIILCNIFFCIIYSLYTGTDNLCIILKLWIYDAHGTLYN